MDRGSGEMDGKVRGQEGSIPALGRATVSAEAMAEKAARATSMNFMMMVFWGVIFGVGDSMKRWRGFGFGKGGFLRELWWMDGYDG